MDTYIVLHLASLLLTLFLPSCSGQTNEQKFNQKEAVTFMEGETAILPCSIYNPGRNKVSWYFDDFKAYIGFVLTRNEKRYIGDERFNVRHRVGTGTQSPSYDHYDLIIENLTYVNQGLYRCVYSLSTHFPTIKTVNLTVQAPTKIIDELSSKDVTAIEGDTVMLVCNMTGIPEPNVTWYKVSNGNREVVQTSGQVFMMHVVSRLDHGTYQCSGYNGVGSAAATRSINVNIHFRPRVSVPVYSISEHPGSNTALECEVSANPFGVAEWRRDDRDIDLSRTEKYKAQLSDGSQETTKILSLQVMDLQQEDYGQYECVAMNTRGMDHVYITLEDAHSVTDGSTHSVSETTGTQTSSTHSVSETTGTQTSSTTSKPIDDETTTDVDTSQARKKISNETAEVTRQEFYRDQMLTNKLWRQMIAREHTFYDYIKRILDEREH